MAALLLTIIGIVIVGLVAMTIYRRPSETPNADAILMASLEHSVEQAHGWPSQTFESDIAAREASNVAWAARNPQAIVPQLVVDAE